MLKTFIFLFLFIGGIYFIYRRVFNSLETFINDSGKERKSCNNGKLERKIGDLKNNLDRIYEKVQKIDYDLNEED